METIMGSSQPPTESSSSAETAPTGSSLAEPSDLRTYLKEQLIAAFKKQLESSGIDTNAQDALIRLVQTGVVTTPLVLTAVRNPIDPVQDE